MRKILFLLLIFSGAGAVLADLPPAEKRLADVRNAFDRYVMNGDTSLIESFSKADIEFAILRDSAIVGQYESLVPRYKAMEKRVEEIRGKESGERQAKEKWLDRFYSFVIGIVSVLAISSIKKRLDGSAERIQ